MTSQVLVTFLTMTSLISRCIGFVQVNFFSNLFMTCFKLAHSFNGFYVSLKYVTVCNDVFCCLSFNNF